MPIFFSLDPKTFPHFKSCTIQNGTTVYSNHSIPSDCSCVAPIPADPDFGGPGLIASFCFLAWLTIFVATIPAFYDIRDQWRKSKPPLRIFRFLGLIMSTQVPEVNPQVQRDSATRFTPDENFGDHALCDKLGSEPPSPIKALAVPRPIQVANALLVSLTDIQTFTGLAIVISAFVQHRRISFYHEQFAVNLWWLTLNSLWVSRINYNEDTPAMSTWRVQVRRCFIIASVIMSAVLQIWVALRERRYWDPLKGRKCYVGNSLGDNFGQSVFWFAGTALYGLVLVLGVLRVTRSWIDRTIFARLPRSIAYFKSRMRGAYMDLRTQRSAGAKRSVAFARMLGYGSAFMCWWSVVQFLSIWSAGNSSHAIELVVYTIFAGSNTWWVIALKVNNIHLVQGDESKWTFGQSLPLMLGGLVVFAGLDAVS